MVFALLSLGWVVFALLSLGWMASDETLRRFSRRVKLAFSVEKRKSEPAGRQVTYVL